MSAFIYTATGESLPSDAVAPSLATTVKPSSNTAYFQRAKETTIRALSQQHPVQGRKLANEFSVSIDDIEPGEMGTMTGSCKGANVKVLYQRPRIVHKRAETGTAHPERKPIQVKKAKVVTSSVPVKKAVALSGATLKRLKESEKTMEKPMVLKLKRKSVEAMRTVKLKQVVSRKEEGLISKKQSSEKTPSTDEPSKENKKEDINLPHAGNRYKNQYGDIKRALSARAAKEVREKKEKEQLKKVERETRQLEIKQMVEQARQKTKESMQKQQGKKIESLAEREQRLKYERIAKEQREMRERKREIMERRKSEGRSAVGTHIIPEKVIQRVHEQRLKEKEQKMKQEKEQKLQRPVSAQPRFNKDIMEVMDEKEKGAGIGEDTQVKEQKKRQYQNWIREHFESQKKAERDRKQAEQDGKRAKEQKLKELDERRRQALQKKEEEKDIGAVQKKRPATAPKKIKRKSVSLRRYEVMDDEDAVTDSEVEREELIQAAAAMKIKIRVAGAAVENEYEEESESLIPPLEGEGLDVIYERPAPPAFNQSSIAKQPSQEIQAEAHSAVSLPEQKLSGSSEGSGVNPLRHQILIERYNAIKERTEELKRREVQKMQQEQQQKEEVKSEAVLVELYQPPKESVVEVSGEGSLEDLYRYNEKKEWRELKMDQDTTAATASKERRVINLKEKDLLEKVKGAVPGSKDMHRDLQKQIVDMKQQKWEAAILIQKMYKGYRARQQLEKLKRGVREIDAEIERYEKMYLENIRRFEFPPQSKVVEESAFRGGVLGPAKKAEGIQQRARVLDRQPAREEQSMHSWTTRDSTNAEYDPLNMVDALLRANPDAFGELRPSALEQEDVRGVSGQSTGGAALRTPRGQDDEVRIMGSVEELKEIKRRESAASVSGSKAGVTRFGHQYITTQPDEVSEVSEVYTQDFVEESQFLPKPKPGRGRLQSSVGKSLNVSDSIQESIHITESFVSPHGNVPPLKKGRPGKSGMSALYESIASVPQESHLLQGTGRSGAAEVEESMHFEKSSMRPQEVTEEEAYSENFESLQESQSMFKPIKQKLSGSIGKSSPRQPIRGAAMGLQKAAQLEGEIQKKVAEREQAILARRVIEQEQEIKHQKQIIQLKDEQMKRWMDNSQRVIDEKNKKHLEALQSVTDSFLAHLRGIQLQPVTPTQRPVKPAADLLGSQKLIVPKSVEESVGDYSEDFESLEESKTMGGLGGAGKKVQTPIREIKEEKSEDSIYEEIERVDESEYFAESTEKKQPQQKHRRERSAESPFTSPGAQADEVSEAISESIPESIPTEEESVPEEVHTRSNLKDTGRGSTNEQIMESTELKSVRRSTGATSPLMGLRKSKLASTLEEQNRGAERRDSVTDVRKRSPEGIDSVIVKLERSLERKRQKEMQALSLLLQDKKITQGEYRSKKRELEAQFQSERGSIREAKRQLRSGWDRAQDVIDRLAADKTFIVSTLGGAHDTQEDSSGAIGGSTDSLKEVQRQMMEVSASLGVDPKIAKEQKELRRKRESAQKLIEQKEKAIEEGLRKKLMEVEKEHIDELLNIALHMDINKEINERAQRAMESMKRRDISPDALRRAKETAAAASISTAQKEQTPKKYEVAVTSPGGGKKQLKMEQEDEDPNEISESIQETFQAESIGSKVLGGGGVTGALSKMEQTGGEGSYSQDFESDSQFYSQSASKIIKPPGPGKKQIANEEIKEEEESVAPQEKKEDVFSDDFRSGTIDSAFLKDQESQSDDKIAGSGNSVDWVFTLEQDEKYKQEKAAAELVVKQAVDLDKELLEASEVYSEDFEDFEDQEKQEENGAQESAQKSGRREKVEDEDRRPDILADELLKLLLQDAVPETFTLRRPRLLLSRLEDKLDEQIEARKIEEEEKIREQRKTKKLGIRRDQAAVAQYIDAVFSEMRMGGVTDDDIADDLNLALSVPAEVSGVGDNFTPRGRSSSLLSRQTSARNALNKSQSGGALSFREYPEKNVFYRLRSKRVNRAELYANLSLDPSIDPRGRRLNQFIEEEEERQMLMDSLMKHEEMVFKTIQACFEEWFSTHAMPKQTAMLLHRDRARVGGIKEVQGREVRGILREIKNKVLGIAENECGVIDLPQSVLIHAEAVYQKDHGDDFFSRSSRVERGVNISEEIEKLREKRMKELIVREIQQSEGKWTQFQREETRVKRELADELVDFLAEDVAEWLCEAERGR